MIAKITKKKFTNILITTTLSKIVFIFLLYGWGHETTETLNNLLVLIHSEVVEVELEPTQSESTARIYPLWRQFFFAIKILTCYGSKDLRVSERVHIVLF